jgi:diguanylate cyclase (GGDEF)-like protein
MTQPEPIQVLIVEENADEARRLRQMLRSALGGKFQLRRTGRMSEAQRRLQDDGADVVVADLRLPDARGMEVVREILRAAPGVPLVVLSGREDDRLAAELLQQGAQDFLVKSEMTNGQLGRALCHAIARQRLQVSLRSLSLIDELTGLHNRRGFVTLAEQRLKLAARQGLHSSLVFVDLDDLKHINDTFGHREGDRALQRVAEAFRECFRESDVVARIGGDEFCALLSDAPQSGEVILHRRLSRALGIREGGPGRGYRVTVSVGIVEVRGAYDLERQLARADARMYQEKRSKPARIPVTHPRAMRLPV